MPETRNRLIAFVAERHPLTLPAVARAWDRAPGEPSAFLEHLRDALRRAIPRGPSTEVTPRVSLTTRLETETQRVVSDLEGFFAREEVLSSITGEERRQILRGMVLTRAVDNQLKLLFTSSPVRWGARAFQGKGFRSLGQEAIYAAPLRLRRKSDGTGDVIAPMIRDLGALLAMRGDAEAVESVLRAQMGKAGPPMDGKDLHVGDLAHGIFPASAPLGISALTVAGLAMGFAQEGSERVAVSLIGEGATSLGEWHEAINLASARRLPAVFCVENNQTALSTPVRENSAARAFADKAIGYGIPGLTIDGTDPEMILAAFTWAAERARGGHGPTLLELVSLRIAGHAHHDDMLYLGKDPQVSWDYPDLHEGGYADREAWGYWAKKDPIRAYAAKLEALRLLAPGELDRWKEDARLLVEAAAERVVGAPWPNPESAGAAVCAGEAPRRHRDPLAETEPAPASLDLEPGPPLDPKGHTFLEAIMLGVGDALRSDPRVFVYGQDVGGKYGNAFLLLKPLLEEFQDRIVNSTLAEGGILGVCTGAAIAGRRPIGEIQFNDFVATGFNQLVNNAAKVRYRWGGSVPLVVRMPWGGLRSAGPFHSQNTEAWFYRTPGLKILVPSTPHDARAGLAAAILDPDPVLFFEHIALYRDPRVRQRMDDAPPAPLPLGRAALRRQGRHLALVSYGAYVHVALRVAERLAEDGIEAAVLDLRWLAPLDRGALLSLARATGRVLIVHEDTRTGGIGESLAAIIQEECFESLDAPVRVVGSLDTPVPYAPPLEEAFLAGEDRIYEAARRLAAY